MLSREQIDQATDLPVKELDMEKEWGGTVGLRTVTGNEREEIEAIISSEKDAKKKDKADALCRACAYFLCDGTGTRLYKDDEAHLLGKRSLSSLKKVFEAAADHNGMTQKGREEAGKSSPDPSS